MTLPSASRVRQATATWTLRRRLLVAVVALFVLLTMAIALASIVLMRTVLISRLDAQLTTLAQETSDIATASIVRGSGKFTPDTRGVAEGSVFVTVNADGEVTGAISSSHGAPAEVDNSYALLMADAATTTPSTLNLGSEGEFRVLSVAISVPTSDDDDTDYGHLIVALPTSNANQTMLALTFVIAISAFIATIVLASIADLIIRRALRPLTDVVSTTERISQLPLDSGDVELTQRVRIEEPGTEVGRVGESVNRMLNHIEASLETRAESERKVRQFVADASHELRTPLAAVRGYAEITRKHETGLSEQGQLSLTRIEGAASRMAELVNDLLLLARLDEGRELQHDDVDLSLLVVEAVADAQAASREHPVTLDIPEEPVMVLGDRLRIQQVIANLLANARVHTPDGTRVHASLSTGGGRATIVIADEGPGIDPALQGTLFERFVRGDQSRSRIAGSSGLGLAIVRAIVEAHGGSISVQSQPGSTAFAVVLPLPDDETAPASAVLQ